MRNYKIFLILAAAILIGNPVSVLAAEDLSGTVGVGTADPSEGAGQTSGTDPSAVDATSSAGAMTDSSLGTSAASSDTSSLSSEYTEEELFSQGGGYIPYIYTFAHPKNVNLPDTVTRYLPWVERYCAENSISEYVPYAMAIINNESGGTTMDVMGCQGGDPYSSIVEGCRLFALCIDDAKEAGADINSAVQGYNYGSNFCYYVGSAGGIYTQSLSDMYAYTASGGKRIPFPNNVGFGWIYNYGCQYYVGLTMSYLEEMNEQELAEYNAKQSAKNIDYVLWLRNYAAEEGHGYSDLYYKGTRNVNAASLIYLALQNNGYLVGEKADCPFDRESLVPVITAHGFMEVPEAAADYTKLHAGDILIGDSVLAVFVGDGCIVSAENTEDAVAIRDIPQGVAYQVYRCSGKEEPLNDYTAWMVEHAYDDIYGYAKYGRNDPDVNESSFVYYALASAGYLEGEDRTDYFDRDTEPEILFRHGFTEITTEVIPAARNISAQQEAAPPPAAEETAAPAVTEENSQPAEDTNTVSGTIPDPGLNLSSGPEMQSAPRDAVPIEAEETSAEDAGTDGSDVNQQEDAAIQSTTGTEAEPQAGDAGEQVQKDTAEQQNTEPQQNTEEQQELTYISPVPADFEGGEADLSLLRPGDILIGANGENAVYVNGGRFVFAQDVRKSTADFGAGDQSGQEVTIGRLDGVRWIHVFRLQVKDEQKEEKNIIGVLSWNGGTEADRPEDIGILLVENGKAVRKITVPTHDGYTYCFAGVNASKKYTIYSDEVPGYLKSYNGFDITYTKDE